MPETSEQGKTPADTQAVAAQEQQNVNQQTAADGQDGETFDKARAMETIHKLREIEKQYNKERKEIERLKADEAKRQDAELSELQKAQKRAADLEGELQRERVEKLRRKVAAKHQLPDFLADRLKGETEEELETDAAQLAANLPKQQPEKRTNLKANDVAGGEQKETDQQRRARLYHFGNNPFNAETAARNGGGVFFVEKQ